MLACRLHVYFEAVHLASADGQQGKKGKKQERDGGMLEHDYLQNNRGCCEHCYQAVRDGVSNCWKYAHNLPLPNR